MQIDNFIFLRGDPFQKINVEEGFQNLNRVPPLYTQFGTQGKTLK